MLTFSFRRWSSHHPWCSHLCRSPTEPMREVTLKQSVKVIPGKSKLAIERVIVLWLFQKRPWNVRDLFHQQFHGPIFFHGCFLDFQGELYSLLSSSLHSYAWQTEVKTLAMTIWKVVLSLRCFPCLSHSGSKSRKQFHTPPVTTYTKVRTIQKLCWVFFGTIVTRTLFWPLLRKKPLPLPIFSTAEAQKQIRRCHFSFSKEFG